MTTKIRLIPGISLIPFLLCLMAFVDAKAQKKVKTTVGLDFGLAIIDFDHNTKSTNPIIQGGNPKSTLNSGSVSVFTEIMKPRKGHDEKYGPGSGLKLKFCYNNFKMSCDAPDWSGPEFYKFSYIGGSLLYKLCFYSKEGDVASSRDPDKITLVQHDSREWDVYYLEGETHPGYHTVVSLSLFTGPQFCSLLDASYKSGNSLYNDGFKAIRNNISDNDVSWVAGLESRMGRGLIEFSYQFGMRSMYATEDIRLKGFYVKLGFAF